MSKDPELSRLKSEMDRLFELKQSAYQEMKQAGEARTRAKDNLDASWERVESAREDMNSAFEDRQRDWDNFKSELARLSHAIDEASRNAEYYHERMKASYEEAHNAYEYGDRASAPGYSAEAQEYRELRDYHNEEKRALIDERRSLEKPSDTNFNYYKAVYERTKREHEREQSEYHAIKDTHERAKANFEDAKIAHANALSAFRARKEELKGMTMYDRRARSNSTPTAGAGYLYAQGKNAGYGHSTQVYADGYRVSRSTTDGGKTSEKTHWINQSIKKGNKNRHARPVDANY